MKFRLTVGENGTAFGKQRVIHTADANNVIEFVKAFVESKNSDYVTNYIIQNAWVDAGEETLPIAVQNLIF